MDDSRIDGSTSPLTRRGFLRAGSVSLGALAGSGLLKAIAIPAEGPKKVRMAVVGGGFGAGFWWHQHPGCAVTAVTDLLPDRRKNLVDRYGCPNTFNSLEEMLQKGADTFDAVAIFTGAPDHVKHAVMCMKAGKHVISAVPAAVSLEECQLLKETKEKTGLRYMMAESSYYRQECIAARDLYQKGEFGNLFYSECEYYHNFICSQPSEPDVWRFGFPPMLYPTHSTAFLVGVTKERIKSLYCIGMSEEGFPKDNPYKNPFANEVALGKTDRGNACRIGVFWRVAAGGERAQWFGTKMSCYMASSGGLANSVETPEQGCRPWTVPEYWKTDRLPEPMRHDSGHGGSAAFITAEFVNALLEHREPAVDVYEALAMTAPGIVAHQSALKGGELMQVPSFG